VKRTSIVLLAALAFATPAMANDTMQGDMRIMQPWSRALPPVSVNGAAYMTLMNTGTVADKLISISTPAARKAEVHTHVMDDGMMKMRPVGDLEIPPGDSAVMQPGGLHIMLMGLTAPLVEGETYPLTLNFERAGSIELKVMIMEPGESGHGHMKMDQKKTGG
jgi:periplasmic copper chaperone A